MIVDEVAVNHIIYLQKAYPSQSDNIPYLTNEINNYFSKKSIDQRVTILCNSMVEKKVSGMMLYKHYPLLLFFSKEYGDSRKIIFNKKENKRIFVAFKEMCIDFGIPCHLKKHGNSTKKIFRKLPSFKELKLEEVKSGKEKPICDWKPIWKFLHDHGYFRYKEGVQWILDNSLIKFPASFWVKAIKNYTLGAYKGWKIKDYYASEGNCFYIILKEVGV